MTLSTFHSAKGLEFPVVFVTGVEEGIVPLAPRDDEDSDNNGATSDIDEQTSDIDEQTSDISEQTSDISEQTSGGYEPTMDIDVAEERRLLYVAMTRASKRLYLTKAEERKTYPNPGKRGESPFLANVDRKFFNEEGSVVINRKAEAAKRRKATREKIEERAQTTQTLW